jgi:S1 RNA binding domain/Zc3h12a-like Ribonuclease NYN domain
MINPRVVVDGSNIATEGRTLPSLEQLDEAVRAFLREFPDTEVTVVVDATFGHRIAESERPTYEEAVLAGELVSPPAGAIGRGDAFVLSIASRADATVFSNDSFQEFHGQYTWLFDEGRLIGGKPIPNVGWVFVLRSPVRGVASRRATQRASKATKAVEKSAPKKAAPKKSAPKGRSERSAPASTPPAETAPAKKAAAAPPDQGRSGSGRDKRRRGGGRGGAGGGGGSAPEPVNEPLAFLAFVSHHPVGTEVEGTVDRFSSHGAYVAVEGAQCYLPLRLMADPPPKSAKELLSVGDTRSFVVESFDSPRRSIDLAIPGLGSATTPGSAPEQTSPAEEAPSMAAPRKTAAKKKATAKRAPAKKKATAKRAPAKRKATTKRAPAKKTAKKKAPAKRKAAAKRAPAKKKATAKRAPAKKKATARKAPAKRKTTTRRAAAKKR